MYEPVQTKAAYLEGIASDSDKGALSRILEIYHKIISDQTLTASLFWGVELAIV